MPNDDHASADSVAAMVGVHPFTVNRWVQTGLLVAVDCDGLSIQKFHSDQASEFWIPVETLWNFCTNNELELDFSRLTRMPIPATSKNENSVLVTLPNQNEPRADLSSLFIYCTNFLVTLTGFMAAVFGSQADVSPSESRFVLICGICLVIAGVMGIWMQMIFRRVGVSISYLLAEVLLVALLLGTGP